MRAVAIALLAPITLFALTGLWGAFALTTGLVAAGVPYGVALSTAIVYRLVTFWIPIPVGWLSLQRLQKVGDL